MVDLNEVRKYLPEELTPAHGQRGKYICPLCGSGKGAKGTAALSIKKDGVTWHCFSCLQGGDIFDLISLRDGVDLSEATRRANSKYASAADQVSTSTPKRVQQPQQAVTQPRDFKAEIQAFHQAIAGSAGEKYLHGRGITTESIDRFSLGYDARREQIIIPYNKRGSYYGMRNISSNATHPHDKPSGVTAPLFNSAALYGSEPCFVVESPLCAISIMQEGGSAVALGGTNIRLLQTEIDKKRPDALLLLSLDNDEPKANGRRPGQEAQKELGAWLEERGIPYADANISGECKDPNQALQQEPEAFRIRIAGAVEAYKDQQDIAENQQRESYMSEAAAGFVDAFVDGVKESAATPPIPTGFYALDAMMDGGLYEGLYTVGAVSSLGKTSFVLQMCDQIAAAGHDVLFFSLEMGQYELMAKSISRLTRLITEERGLSSGVAKSTRGILSGHKHEKYSSTEKEVISQAVTRYRKDISGHIWFVPGIGNIGTAEIRSRVERHISLTGRRPVVVVDYLQILAPADIRASDKQNTDRNVLELKRLSRDHKIPVIGISSLNRDNYTEPINTAAFKESGAIEYGSDCLIGLQYVGMEYREGEKEQQRHQRIRELINSNDAAAKRGESVEIEVRLLKNRNGTKGISDPLMFFPVFNLFREHPAGMIPVCVETPFKRGL